MSQQRPTHTKITPNEVTSVVWNVARYIATGVEPDNVSVTMTRIVPLPEADASDLLPGAASINGPIITQPINGNLLALNAVYRVDLTFSADVNTTVELQAFLYVENASPYPMSGVSLLEFRQRCGSMLNDLILVEATADTETDDLSSLVDMNTITLPLGELKNRIIYFYDGTSENIGLQRVITENFPGEGRIRWNNNINVPVKAGDRAELWNHRAQGLRPSQMNEFIKIAHAEASVYNHTNMTLTVTDDFTATEPNNTITIPTGISKIYQVQYMTADQVWIDVPKSIPAGPGYWVDPYSRVLTINRPVSTWADGSVIRIMVRGREFPLERDTDVSMINAEWICARACELACTALVNRNPDQNVYRDKMYKYERIAQSMRTLIVPRTRVGTTLEW